MRFTLATALGTVGSIFHELQLLLGAWPGEGEVDQVLVGGLFEILELLLGLCSVNADGLKLLLGDTHIVRFGPTCVCAFVVLGQTLVVVDDLLNSGHSGFRLLPCPSVLE